MNNTEQNKEQLLLLVDKYLEGATTEVENKRLINYFESFQNEEGWNQSFGSKEETKVKMLLRLQEAINKEDNTDKVIPIQKLKSKRKTFLKYAIAASVVLLLSLSFFLNQQTAEITSPIVVEHSIAPGSDKATLTLEDGSIVALEKGKTYESTNVNSDGEELVYNTQAEASKPEIVYNYLTIPRGGQFFVKLSDGTKVWLNSESQLKYPVTFTDGETRNVELVYGEAYFEVSASTNHHGASFNVQSRNQNIEVLGTEFNVKAYQDEVENYTTLVEGKIALNANHQTEILKPNQQAIVNPNNEKIGIKTVDVYNEISWKDGIFSFEDKSLKEIMKVLSRWYDMDVVFENKAIEGEQFLGVLGKEQTIEDILVSINNFGIIKGYEIKDKTIVLK